MQTLAEILIATIAEILMETLAENSEETPSSSKFITRLENCSSKREYRTWICVRSLGTQPRGCTGDRGEHHGIPMLAQHRHLPAQIPVRFLQRCHLGVLVPPNPLPPSSLHDITPLSGVLMPSILSPPSTLDDSPWGRQYWSTKVY